MRANHLGHVVTFACFGFRLAHLFLEFTFFLDGFGLEGRLDFFFDHRAVGQFNRWQLALGDAISRNIGAGDFYGR